MADRQRLMHEHGLVGRRYAGEVRQIITGSIGFDDWEWGVDLFADDPLVFKKLIYEMRFDEVSAVYALFGPFYVGLRLTAAELGAMLGGVTLPTASSPRARRSTADARRNPVRPSHHLGGENNLSRVQREMLHHVIDRFQNRHVVFLNHHALGQAFRRDRRDHRRGLRDNSPQPLLNSGIELPPRAENSRSRSRVSGAPPTPATIHWRTLPARCSTRLPTAFSFSLPRAQTCSSVSLPRSVPCAARNAPPRDRWLPEPTPRTSESPRARPGVPL